MSTRMALRSWASPSVFVITGALLALLTEVYFAYYDISYREVIVALCLLGCVFVLLAGRNGLRVGLIFLVITFGLGYRTMSISPDLRVHPSELVILGLLGLLIVQPSEWWRNKAVPRLPIWLILFIPFWLWGWRNIGSGGIKWQSMFSEFKNFIVVIPLFVLASLVLAEKNGWRQVLVVFYLVGAWVAALGLLEYLFPQVKTILPGFVSDPVPRETGEGFQRAAFSFWGSSDAIYVCVLALPMTIIVWEWWSAWWTRVINLVLLATLFWGAYVSGHRNSWLIITLQFLGFIVLKKQYILGLALSVTLLFISVSAYQLLPTEARDRIYSGAELLTGNPVNSDTSGQKRWYRASTSFNDSLEEPLGKGWGAAGWVHNDFLQVAENLGLAAGVLFLGAFLLTLYRLLQRIRAVSHFSEPRTLGIALFLSFSSAGIVLATEAALVLPQLILPIWFVWVITEIWLRQTKMKRVALNEAFSTFGTFANLQLREHHSPDFRSGQMGR